MGLNIYGSVGNRGANHLKDVKLIQALLNVYLRRECKKELKIDGKSGKNTAAIISEFQSQEVKMSKPDGNVGPHGRTFRELKAVLEGVYRDGLALIKPIIGLMTFNAEGHEGGLFHSRRLHVPSSGSGITIGRGYDMKAKNGVNIKEDLIKAGVSTFYAQALSMGEGLKHEVARQFIIDNDLLDFTITPLEQKTLFAISYSEKEATVKRICAKKDTQRAYGVVNWEKLDNNIKIITIDLCFRGDYSSTVRKFIQKHIVNNDVKEFKVAMSDRGYWMGARGVPKSRFEERIALLNK